MSDWLRSLVVAMLSSLVLAFICDGTARAAGPSSTPRERERAALAYDSGVHAYEQSDYAAAARRFLEADELAPNDDALLNALVAAKRSADLALVRETAERILSRPRENAELESAARAALSAPPVDVVSSAAPGPEPAARGRASTPQTALIPATATTAKPSNDDAPKRAWARPLFYGGVALTAALTGLTIWSGLDTLAARRELPGTQADNDSVTARAHRTDALLAATLLGAAGTLCVGVGWVDWGAGARPVRVAAQLSPARALVALGGSF